MNIDTIKRKKGIVFRARVGSGPNRAIKYFQRKSDAHVWVAEMKVRKAAELGQVVTTLPTPAPTEQVPGTNPISLAEAYELFSKGYAEIQQEPGTRIREAKIVEQHLKPYFGQRDLSALGQKDVQQYLYQELRKGDLKAATINKHHQVIHKVCAWAVKNGLIERNPAAGISKLPVQDSVYSANFKFLEEQDLYRALAKAQELYPREYPVMLTAVAAGLRAGEVCGLRRADLIESGATPVLMVRRTYDCKVRDFKDTTKGGSARVVPVSDSLLEVLRPVALAKRPGDLLFFADKGEAIRTRNTLLKKWARAQKLCEIEPRTFHALRHTFATLFLSHGGNTFALQRILGHSNPKITDKYSHFSQSLMETSRNVLQIPSELRAGKGG